MTNFKDKAAEIVQQMLVDYTAWVNGEPTPWNVKKREALEALAALNDQEKESYKIEIITDFIRFSRETKERMEKESS